MLIQSQYVALRWQLAFALLSIVALPVRAEDRPPTNQDGSGGSIPTTEPVISEGIRGPNRERIGMQNGVRIYTGIGSTGARFGRSTEGREQQGNDSDKESDDDEDSSEQPCPQSDTASDTLKGNPIYIATGNKLEPELDFAASGEWPLYLKRTYNHHWNGLGLFGRRWLSNYDYRLSFESSYWSGAGVCYARPGIAECSNTGTASTIWVHRPDGRKLRFLKAPDGAYYEDRAIPVAKIVRQVDGTWVMYGQDNMVETYSVGGYPLRIRNEAGIGWVFRYGGLNNTQLQEVTHTSGRSVDFIWVDDELREVRDPSDRSYTFTYVGQGTETGIHSLKTAKGPGSTSPLVMYHYSGEGGEPNGISSGELTGKSFNGVRYSRFSYQGQYAATTEHANGVEKYSFVYTLGAEGALTVSETSPLGKKATYLFKDGRIQSVTGIPSNHCAGAYKETSYDANGYENLVVDFNGNATNYDYNADGRLIQRVDAFSTPDARTTNYVWDTSSNNVSSLTVAGLKRTDYTYTSGNRVASVAVTNLVPNTPAHAQTTFYSYTTHPNGLLATASIDGPLANDTIVYTYNTQGDLTEVRNALGHAVSYSNYNALGQVGRVIGVNGAVSDYTYDERGRLATVREIVGGVSQPPTIYTYDTVGRLATVQTPDGRIRTREFDAAWRVSREYEPEPGGTWAVNRYTYNNASLITSVETMRTTALNPPSAAPTLSVPANGYNGTYTVSWTSAAGTEFYRLEESIGGGAWAVAFEGNALSKAYIAKPVGTYAYRITACNAAGCSATIGPASANVIYPPGGAPTIVAPSQNTDGSYQVSWNAVAGATLYQLEEAVNGGLWVNIQDASTTFKDLVLKNAGSYAYRVRGYNGAGAGPWSTTVTVVEIDPPGAPPNLSGPNVNMTGSYSVAWTTVSGATSYQLDESVNGGVWAAVPSISGTSKAFAGKPITSDHSYRVRACNAAGCGVNSSSLTVQRIIYGAQYVSQSIPSSIMSGEVVGVSVTMKNTGNATWSATYGFRLGSQNAQDNTRWGLNRVVVPGAVAPGQTVTFNFNITGPTPDAGGGSGMRAFQWQMVRDGYTWFGDMTPNTGIWLDVPQEQEPDPCGGRPNCYEN
jgi:YD repeat-containing protein